MRRQETCMKPQEVFNFLSLSSSFSFWLLFWSSLAFASSYVSRIFQTIPTGTIGKSRRARWRLLRQGISTNIDLVLENSVQHRVCFVFPITQSDLPHRSPILLWPIPLPLLLACHPYSLVPSLTEDTSKLFEPVAPATSSILLRWNVA